MALFILVNNNMIFNFLDKYRSISINRISDFFDRKCIRHHCIPEHNKIDFMLDDFQFGIWIDKKYFLIELLCPIASEDKKEKPVDRRGAEEACLGITKQIKVLKAYYTIVDYIDEDNANKLAKCNTIRFSFDSFCYNMYDFSILFHDALNVIHFGFNEYHKLYDEIISKTHSAPVGFRTFDSEVSVEQSPITNHHIGFV